MQIFVVEPHQPPPHHHHSPPTLTYLGSCLSEFLTTCEVTLIHKMRLISIHERVSERERKKYLRLAFVSNRATCCFQINKKQAAYSSVSFNNNNNKKTDDQSDWTGLDSKQICCELSNFKPNLKANCIYCFFHSRVVGSFFDANKNNETYQSKRPTEPSIHPLIDHITSHRRRATHFLNSGSRLVRLFHGLECGTITLRGAFCDGPAVVLLLLVLN